MGKSLFKRKAKNKTDAKAKAGTDAGAQDLDKRLARVERRQLSILRLLQQLQHDLGQPPRNAGAEDRPGADLYAPGIAQRGYGVHSMHGEDGIIVHALRRLGAPRRTFFEIGVQDGLECNSANLAFHFGWSGVLFEGDPDLAAAAEKNYGAHPNVRVRNAFVTRENINALMEDAGVDLECDLFSLDIDGNDYWIWKALREDFRPRLVVAEYNSAFGPERAVTIPYVPDFRHRAKYPRYYFGASLPALTRLAEKRGYALIGSSDAGNNAFFARRDALAAANESEGGAATPGALREVSVQEAYRPHYLRRHGPEILEPLRDLEYVEVP